MTVAGKRSQAYSCPHLGLANYPSGHSDRALEEHRCYLSTARERIDLAHQTVFCLSRQSRNCPWLQVRPKRQPRAKSFWQGMGYIGRQIALAVFKPVSADGGIDTCAKVANR